LESLDEKTVAAYIFNPKLGPKQLIRSINDEFGLQYNADDTKDLIDKLNRFLIQKKSERKRVLILIDEAQNLSKTVLEQLRLLSNLETSKEKLLQIILVGQPELAAMLDSHDLRQVGQRISLRCQILPLSIQETQEYIQYRLNIASQKRSPLFNPAAIRKIYAYSRGIPRLINIACDRALLAAFSTNQRQVTGRVAKAALSEMTHRGRARQTGLMDGRKALGFFLLLCAIAAALLYFKPLREVVSARFKASPSATATAPSVDLPAAVAAWVHPASETASGSALAADAFAGRPPSVSPGETPAAAGTGTRLAARLMHINTQSSRLAALRETLEAWGSNLEAKPYLEAVDDDATFFNLSAKAAGYLIQRVEADLAVLRKVNMPAILEFRAGAKRPPGYLALIAVVGDKLLLKGSEETAVEADPDEIDQSWTGVAYIPWKNFLSLAGTIPGSAPADSVVGLKMLLRDLGNKSVPLSKEYDPATQKTIEQLQGKYGLPVDGVVGPLTKIVLYREGKHFDIPQLASK
jgi:general secretion pathway protein A